MITCLVYLPLSYVGRGPAESCVQIIQQFSEAGINTELFVPRIRKVVAKAVNVCPTLAWPLRKLPWRWIADHGRTSMEAKFYQRLKLANPDETIVYFWPDTPISLLKKAKELGFTCVREMINNPCEAAKTILDDAYLAQNLPPTHPVTQIKVQTENDEIEHYDYFFSSNDEVDRALIEKGIAPQKILKASFGWDVGRFEGRAPTLPRCDGVRLVFVGSINVRKGIPELLEAWKQSGVRGELCLAGAIEPCLQVLLDEHLRYGNVKYLGFVNDVASLYHSCDVFVFPTLEEGGPQVTYEAAGCGLPVITTPMGAARLVKTGENGTVVPAGDVNALAEAIRFLGNNPDVRNAYSKRARNDAVYFEYLNVGKRRAEQLKAAIALRVR